MVSARGEVKLLDFGIMKAEGSASPRRGRHVKGNVCFMSPEQARGLPVDPRADLFSPGCDPLCRDGGAHLPGRHLL